MVYLIEFVEGVPFSERTTEDQVQDEAEEHSGSDGDGQDSEIVVDSRHGEL